MEIRGDSPFRLEKLTYREMQRLAELRSVGLALMCTPKPGST